jgi:hypothetical protein
MSLINIRVRDALRQIFGGYVYYDGMPLPPLWETDYREVLHDADDYDAYLHRQIDAVMGDDAVPLWYMAEMLCERATICLGWKAFLVEVRGED